MNTSYRGQHTAPDAEYGAPLHDVEAMMPDYYQHPEYYQTGAGDDIDGPSRRAIFRSEGEPDAPVWMWRAVPDDVHTFNPGDWVTTSHAYAAQHAIQDDEPANDWPVLSLVVRADEVRTGGNDIFEWGYCPRI